MHVLADCLFVAAGGALGSVLRYLLGLLPLKPASGFPVITLVINVFGAFCIGIVAMLAGKRSGLDPQLLLFLKVGLCGGFTTFSTFSYEATLLLQNGKIGTGILYMLLSITLCLAAIGSTQLLAR